MRIIVTGVPGVGKSTVMEGLASSQGLEIINFGTVMFETARNDGVATDRDQLRRLAPEVQRRIQQKAGLTIGAKASCIIDTHATVRTSRGYLAGLPIWVLDAIKPEVLVLVEAPAEQIHRRRGADPSRVRDAQSAAEIEQHQQFNRAIAAAYAMHSGATVLTVSNPDGYVESALAQLREALG